MATATPSFPFYPQRFISATNHWPPEAAGAYLRLLMHQWDNIFIPNIEYSIRRITGLEEEKFGLFGLFICAKFVEVEPGKLQNIFLEEIRAGKNSFVEKQRVNGAKGGRPKKEKTQKEPKENPNLSFGETQTKANEKVIGERRKEKGERRIESFAQNNFPTELGFKNIPVIAPTPQKLTGNLRDKCREVYVEFFKASNGGIVPNIQKKDTMALPKLIAWIKVNIAQSIDPAKSETEENEKVIQTFNYIFSRWHMLKDFERNGTDISKIYSNINSIIQQQRHGNTNGNGTTGSTGTSSVGTKSKPGSVESTQAVFSAINSIPDRK